jgi:hypothetical protein
MICAGCETSGNPKLNVAIPDSCQRNAQRVAEPAMKEGDQALAVLARYRAALGLANARIDKVRDCDNNVRGRFAKGG